MNSDFLIAASFSVASLATWWFVMFSDSGFGQMARAMAKKGRYGKNFNALFIPGFGLGGALILLMKILLDLGVSAQLAKGFGAVGAMVIAAAFLGLFPIPLPRWMYPEYHLAKRERIRAEKLVRGEAVKMPSSGRVAVEAQRLEQIVREQEAAQRADKDESSR
ncbi:hypothetical protein [Schaalia sp. Marseille-Q2122]|uniref:hypothetical protein n=1 Tax=Schaalia sp. Marseille-Q2122 TaxID=2736604 RepID=UPI001589D746|nr:hypothetical protein [Schaalia sp. Marseille-Q2122]